MFALLLFFAASTASVSANAIVALNELFTTDDYPADALRRGEQGTVSARITIDASGAVIDCTIAKSSGSELLDATTCAVIRSRAHYLAVSEADRIPVVRTDAIRINWVIPRADGRPVIDAYTRYTFDLAANGALSNCVAEFNGKPWDTTYCDSTIKNFQNFSQATRDFFVSEGRKLALLNGYVLGRDENGSILNPIAGRGHVYGLTTSLTIDEHGSVTQCEIVFYGWYLVAPDEEDSPCKVARKEKFAPLAKSNSNRAPRSLTKIAAVIVSN